MANSKKIHPNEQKLFRDSMQDVKPLKKEGRVSKPNKPKQVIKQPHFIDTSQLDNHISEKLSKEAFLSFYRPGIKHKDFIKLKQGKYLIEAKLDLHGQTVVQAKQSLLAFIQECTEHHNRYALIVHDKGYHSVNHEPTIKSYVNSWLQQLPQILAFCSAKAKDGGTGAVYVLLKKSS